MSKHLPSDEILISIVVPSFNQARYLDATLRSLVDQGHPHKQIIVMDGGSSDGSVDVIRGYESQISIWVSEPDGGQARAIAKGFGLAEGQVIGWLNSDDLMAPGALERLARTVQTVGSADGVFYGGWEVIDADGVVQEVYSRLPMPRWIARALGPAICQPGTFFGRDAYVRVGGVDPALKYSMDLDLWMKFVAAGVPFVKVAGVQAQFRSHSMQKGHTPQWVQHSIEEELVLQQRYGLAAEDSLRGVVARQTLRGLKLITSGPYKTLAFRVLQRRRLRQFRVQYSD